MCIRDSIWSVDRHAQISARDSAAQAPQCLFRPEQRRQFGLKGSSPTHPRALPEPTSSPLEVPWRRPALAGASGQLRWRWRDVVARPAWLAVA
eukprot:1361342-Alexandrium_andersonii.AAC.1